MKRERKFPFFVSVISTGFEYFLPKRAALSLSKNDKSKLPLSNTYRPSFHADIKKYPCKKKYAFRNCLATASSPSPHFSINGYAPLFFQKTAFNVCRDCEYSLRRIPQTSMVFNAARRILYIITQIFRCNSLK